MRHNYLLITALFVMAGCGSQDAEVAPDARTAGFDAANRTERAYLVKRYVLPATADDASNASFVYPGAVQPLNRLGAVVQVNIQLLEGYDVQGKMDQALLDGAARQMMIVEAATLDGVDNGARGRWVRVVDVDEPADATNDYSGTAQFRVASGESVYDVWRGAIDGGKVDATEGLESDFAYDLPLVEGWPVTTIPGRYGQRRATIDEETLRGFAGSVLTLQEVHEEILPAAAELLTRGIAAQVPKADDIRSLFDSNKDDVVTAKELINSSTVGGLLQPDVDLDGDGVNDHLSMGIEFEAVRAELVP